MAKIITFDVNQTLLDLAHPGPAVRGVGRRQLDAPSGSPRCSSSPSISGSQHGPNGSDGTPIDAFGTTSLVRVDETEVVRGGPVRSLPTYRGQRD